MMKSARRYDCHRRFLRAPISAVLLFLFFAFVLWSDGSAQESKTPAKISVTTNLVVLPVSVTDAEGKFVSGLPRESFRVYEDGKPQNVSLFVEEDTPVTVGLIVDHSRSMGNKLVNVSEAVAEFAESSNPQDEMFVVDFSDSVSIESHDGRLFTNDHKELQKALFAVSARGRTALYDAVARALMHLDLGTREKKALVIVSDGGDNASELKFSDVLSLARRAHAVIYSIGLVENSTQEENPHILERLCKETGGIAFITHPGENISNIAKAIARDLREQYTLGYAPKENLKGNAFRKLTVKVDAPLVRGIRVRTRTGYTTLPDANPHAKPAGDSP